jgi:hypothetical protein
MEWYWWIVICGVIFYCISGFVLALIGILDRIRDWRERISHHDKILVIECLKTAAAGMCWGILLVVTIIFAVDAKFFK